MASTKRTPNVEVSGIYRDVVKRSSRKLLGGGRRAGRLLVVPRLGLLHADNEGLDEAKAARSRGGVSRRCSPRSSAT
jgi:hypothetical protein